MTREQMDEMDAWYPSYKTEQGDTDAEERELAGGYDDVIDPDYPHESEREDYPT